MSLNAYKFFGAIKLANLASDPASPELGEMYYNTTSGKVRSYAGGSWADVQAGAPTNTFADDVFRVQSIGDLTKQIAFSAASITTGVTRTITMPNENVNLGSLTNSNISASAAIEYSKLALTGGIVNADINAAAAIAYSKLNLATSIVNTDISASAAIAYSKLNLATSIVNADIAVAAAIAYSKLALTGSIVDADVNASAAIAYSKLSLTGGIVNADVNAAAAIAYSKLSLSGSIVNADINASAAIAYSKLNLSSSIVNADVASGAAIAYSKLNLATSIVNADISASAAIAYSKLAALTNGNRVLISDVSGFVSESSVTSTTLGYLDATSSIQTQLNAKVAKAGDAMTDNLTFATAKGIEATAAASTLNFGTNANATTINIGNSGATVNILGTVLYENVTDLQVADKLITLNKGGAAASGNGTGIEIEEDAAITGYIKVANSRSSFDIKAPASSGTMRFTPSTAAFAGIFAVTSLAADRTYTLPDQSGTVAMISDITLNAANQQLSNLSGTVAMNLDLVGNTNLARSLGSDAIEFSTLWASGINHNDSGTPDLTVQISGNNGNMIVAPHGTGRIRKAKSGALTRYTDEVYIDAVALTASTTAVASSFTFDSKVYKAQIIDYMIVEATTNKRRAGRIRVVCDGASGVASTNISIVDEVNETSDVGVVWSAAMSVDDVQLSYTTTANAKTMNALVTRFLA